MPPAGEAPTAFAERAALAKAHSVATLLLEARDHATASPLPLVIAADTIVVLRDNILGKPRNADDAFAMLSALSGNSHKVITGCALLSPDTFRARTFAVSSDVVMWDCPPELLRSYADSGEPLDKAGAYAVQGAGAFLIKSLHGSWSNVVGLPLAELVQELLGMGVLLPAQPA
jgi:MAF protein